ncbi:MAG: sugar transferase [Candidatus Omnitrophica bacterium]|nr:sugar transferase [Candidatus Omnitrophota bacterium]
MLKRIFDIIFSLIILIFGLPVFAIVFLLIRLDSQGPAIFHQKRVGRDGKMFDFLKFKTMRDVAGPMITAPGDKRITKIGAFLRKAKLDELPQFINVLKGDMSVVGPRPELFEIVNTYNDRQREILSFKPGITSPASIRFRNEENALSKDRVMRSYIKEVLPVKIDCDLEYFRKSSLSSDLTVIFKTIKGVLNAKE